MVLGSDIESQHLDLQPDQKDGGVSSAASQNWIPPQQLSTFLHEIRNPVTTLKTLAKLLTRRLPPEDSNHWIGRSIEQECHHLQDLLSHFEQELSSPAHLQTRPIDLEAFLREHQTTLEAIAQDHNLHFCLEWDSQHAYPLVSADPLALRQVLGNLVDNACKYTPAGGEIHIRLVHRADHLWVEVRDTGMGIEAETLDQIFTPFFRGAHDRPGQGLGLAISRELVRQMGGDIEVESVLGKGSIFRIRLSIAEPSTSPPTTAI